MKITKLLGLILALSLTFSPVLARPVQAAGQVTLLFFDRNFLTCSSKSSFVNVAREALIRVIRESSQQFQLSG